MKHYYATFKTTSEAIEVSFPDLNACVTFGDNWDEALESAVDVLAGWLANAESSFIAAPSSYEQLAKKLKRDEQLVPIAVDGKTLESYQELKRFNVIFPKQILDQVDEYRKKTGLKRSKLLQLAAEEFINNHEDGLNESNVA